ncbi:dTDP-4-keto-L-6-deoxy-hexose 2,3-reductase (plasmid) [Persicobacter psychrovividus]|uniref:dTDP-4-keto-L-6-deoxy-hexose 2,3-reductase n=2 Tax=Persicobacter psychrovividus TaxID=387638 RepID=A0ABM7VMN6_9BACT|nr:dTDP-4-keto-L-6-deoxy-hexose 2,3-reductase [Persicobacter psychrovividus]
MNEVLLKPTYKEDVYAVNDIFSHGGRLVLGCSGLGGVWGDVVEQESVDCILYALENGIKTLDTAPSYNQSEIFVGKALKEWKGPKPFVSSKVGRLPAQAADDCIVDYSSESMRSSLARTLDRLQIDALDLVFLHEPHLVPLNEYDRITDDLLRFKQEGMVKMIGVGGNPTAGFRKALNQKNVFDVVSGFLGLDACNLNALKDDIPLLSQHKIAYYAASGLHMGLLGSRFKQHVQNPPNNEWITNRDVANAVKVNQIAQEIGMPLADLAMKYIFSMQQADRVVIGARTKEQTISLCNIWKQGGLSEDIFNRITDTLIGG